MYCPAQFEENRLDVLLPFIEQHPLATIVSSNSSGLTADHIPLLHVAQEGSPGNLIGHVAKSNPIWHVPPEQEHLVIFQGPSVYISPNWYATKAGAGKVVPTWNYAVVHVSATLRAFHESDTLLQTLDKLTTKHESNQTHPWKISDAPAEFIDRLLNSIVGIELNILSMQGKWKVSQNQPKENRESVVAGLEAQSDQDANRMAELVRRFGAEKA